MAKISPEVTVELSLRIMETVAATATEFKLPSDPETVYETGLQIAGQGLALMLASKFKTSAEVQKDMSDFADRVDKLLAGLMKTPIESSKNEVAAVTPPPINKKNLN